MADQQNPYEAPSADLVVDRDFGEGSLLSSPRKLPAGRGASWLAEAWGYFKQSPLNWVLMFLILVAISFILSLIPLLGGIALYVLYPVFTAGILLACRDQDAGKMVAIERLFAGFSVPQRNKLLILGLLYTVSIIALTIGMMLIVFIIAAIGGGAADVDFGDTPAPGDLLQTGAGVAVTLGLLFSLLLVIPVMMAFYFAPALIIFHEFEIVDALKRSFNGCLSNILPFLLFGILVFVLSMLMLLTFGLGYLVLIPVLMITLYVSYKEIFLES
jgi:uncharacterized membrane protein